MDLLLHPSRRRSTSFREEKRELHRLADDGRHGEVGAGDPKPNGYRCRLPAGEHGLISGIECDIPGIMHFAHTMGSKSNFLYKPATHAPKSSRRSNPQCVVINSDSDEIIERGDKIIQRIADYPCEGEVSLCSAPANNSSDGIVKRIVLEPDAIEDITRKSARIANPHYYYSVTMAKEYPKCIPLMSGANY